MHIRCDYVVSSNPYHYAKPYSVCHRVCPEAVTQTITRTMSQAFVKRCGSTSISEGDAGPSDAALVTSLTVTEAQAQGLVDQIEHPYRRRVCALYIYISTLHARTLQYAHPACTIS